MKIKKSIILLVTLSSYDSEERGEGWSLSTATSSPGVTTVSYFVSSGQRGELALYDLAGRKIKTIWQGNGTGPLAVLDITRENLSAGLFFLVLSGEQNTLTGKCLLW